MSEQLHDQINYYQIPSDNCMSTAAARSENPVEADPGCGNFDINQRPGNDGDFFSSPAEYVFDSKFATGSSAYGRPSLSPSYQHEHETDSSHFEELSITPQGELALPGSNFHYADDPFGVVTAEDESEEFYAELAERWVEEQIQKEDLEHMSAQDNGDFDPLYVALSKSPTKVLCNELFQDNSRYQPISSLKALVDIPSSRTPVTPLLQSVSSTKCGEQNHGSSAKKRSASEVSNTSSTLKLPSKRRNGKNQAYCQVMCPSKKSPSRLQMDNALSERLEAQLALREALYNLEKAQNLVQNCRARYSTAKVAVQTIVETEFDALLQEETPWNNMFRQLKKYKDATGCCNVKQVEDNKSPEMARLAAWIGKQRKRSKLNGKIPGGIASNSRGNLNQQMGTSPPTSSFKHASVATVRQDSCGNHAESSQSELDDVSVFEDFDPEGPLADPYKKIALDSIGFDWDPRTSRWNTMYEELKAFKEAHRTTLVPHANHGLGSWVKRQQVQYNLYTSGSKSELTKERVRLLNDLGFVWSRRNNQWNEFFQQLKRYSEEHGTCNIPDGSDDPELIALAKWVADQRRE
jgi:exonuclease VII small subunit